MRRVIIIILILTYFINTAQSQVLNIEQQRISDTAKFKADARFSFMFVNNNIKFINTRAKLNMQKLVKKDKYIFVGEYDYIYNGSIKILNNAYIHLRYNRTLTKNIIFEAYNQEQNNLQRGVLFRALFGAGIRFKLHNTKKFILNFGNSYMFEYEKTPEIINKNIRMSSYVSEEIVLFKNISLIGTMYYQPIIGRVEDYRINAQANLKLIISKRTSFLLTLNYLYDSNPPIGITKTVSSIINEFVFTF